MKKFLIASLILGAGISAQSQAAELSTLGQGTEIEFTKDLSVYSDGHLKFCDGHKVISDETPTADACVVISAAVYPDSVVSEISVEKGVRIVANPAPYGAVYIRGGDMREGNQLRLETALMYHRTPSNLNLRLTKEFLEKAMGEFVKVKDVKPLVVETIVFKAAQ